MPRIDAIRSERVRLFGTRVGEDELPHCGAIEVTSAQGASRSFFVQAQHLAMADLLGDQALAADGDPLQERSISQVLVIALQHDDDEHDGECHHVQRWIVERQIGQELHDEGTDDRRSQHRLDRRPLRHTD